MTVRTFLPEWNDDSYLGCPISRPSKTVDRGLTFLTRTVSWFSFQTISWSRVVTSFSLSRQRTRGLVRHGLVRHGLRPMWSLTSDYTLSFERKRICLNLTEKTGTLISYVPSPPLEYFRFLPSGPPVVFPRLSSFISGYVLRYVGRKRKVETKTDPRRRRKRETSDWRREGVSGRVLSSRLSGIWQ